MIRIIDPLADPAWGDLLARHPAASVFHTPGWLDALRRTYGFQPFVITAMERSAPSPPEGRRAADAETRTQEGAAPPGPRLTNGLVVCRVNGWRSPRLVSLPFSDHCDALVDDPGDVAAMHAYLAEEVQKGHCRSVELRPRGGAGGPVPVAQPLGPAAGHRAPVVGRSVAVKEGTASVAQPLGPAAGQRAPVAGRSVAVKEGTASVAQPFRAVQTYTLHTLDLRPDLPEIFRRFHPSCVQRAIRRAEREGLTYEAGTSERLLAAFYELLRMTRRRHGLPPQPMAWFRNLVECLPSTPAGRSGQGVTIHVASKDGQAVAAMLTLRFGASLVYKYGGSDARQHRLGGVPFLFWQVIQRVKDLGVVTFDLGRSDVGQTGLVRFKDHLGAERSAMTYYRLPAGSDEPSRAGWAARAARRMFPYLPDPALDFAGRLLYRHLG